MPCMHMLSTSGKHAYVSADACSERDNAVEHCECEDAFRTAGDRREMSVAYVVVV